MQGGLKNFQSALEQANRKIAGSVFRPGKMWLQNVNILSAFIAKKDDDYKVLRIKKRECSVNKAGQKKIKLLEYESL